MTTGDPLVVSGAMKPLPTLTKPLRSVDTETKEPAITRVLALTEYVGVRDDQINLR